MRFHTHIRSRRGTLQCENVGNVMSFRLCHGQFYFADGVSTLLGAFLLCRWLSKHSMLPRAFGLAEGISIWPRAFLFRRKLFLAFLLCRVHFCFAGGISILPRAFLLRGRFFNELLLCRRHSYCAGDIFIFPMTFLTLPNVFLCISTLSGAFLFCRGHF